MEYSITPLTPHTGAEVRGIDLNQGVDAETRAALNRAFAEHHVLVVRGQQFTPPQFIAAAQVFGELFQHDKREMHVPGYPQIYYVSNEQTVPGKRYISGETFDAEGRDTGLIEGAGHRNSPAEGRGFDAPGPRFLENLRDAILPKCCKTRSVASHCVPPRRSSPRDDRPMKRALSITPRNVPAVSALPDYRQKRADRVHGGLEPEQ